MRKLAVFLLIAFALVSGGVTGESLRIGVDANYSLDMARGGARWIWDGEASDLFSGMAGRGVQEFRVRLWTKDEGPHGKDYATEVVKKTLRAGLNPYLVIFLSEDWADMMKQPIPAVWKDLALEERAEAVRTYSRDIVRHFRKAGLQSHMYEIGNEIDYGICGEYPGKGTKKNPETLSRNLWPRSARIIRASQEGVREADPEATFMLHIAHGWDAEFCEAFFRFMLAQGVKIDFAGLSYFPSSNIGGSLEMEQFAATATRVAAAAGCPVMVPETAYPATRDFKGQFSRWKYEVLGYPLTDEGQQRWLADFLACCDQHPDIDAVYYWSPEWCGEGMWKAFALFDPRGCARPAWTSFAKETWTGRKLKDPVYAEVCSNRLYSVPVKEAKKQMIPLVLDLRQKTGGVTVEHIALLSNTVLNAGGYRVDLKGSLQQNLNLIRRADALGIALDRQDEAARAGLKSFAAGIDPKKEKLVLILRAGQTPELDDAIAFFKGKGIQTVLHPKPDDKPLKFGLCGAFSRDGNAVPLMSPKYPP